MIPRVSPNPPSQEDKLLFVIHEFTRDNKLDGRLKLMKTMFFLEHFDTEQNRLVPEKLFSNNEFIIYKHGPFSFEVMRSIERMKKEGLIEETEICGHIVPKLTEKGLKKILEIERKLNPNIKDRILKIKKLFGDYSGKELEIKSLEYLGITLEDKISYIGNPVSVIISESS